MLPKGYAGDADKAYMADLANKLGVDAVVAVSWQTGVRLDSKNLKVFAGTFNPVSIYVVDRTGEQIALVKSKGLDGEYIPMSPNEASAYAPAAKGAAYPGAVSPGGAHATGASGVLTAGGGVSGVTGGDATGGSVDTAPLSETWSVQSAPSQ